MDGLIIHAVLQGLFIQEVKEIFDSRRHDGPGAQDATEEVVDELLQRSLKQATTDVRRGLRDGRDRAPRGECLSTK